MGYPERSVLDLRPSFALPPLVLIVDEHRLCRNALASAITSYGRNLRVQTAVPNATGLVSCLKGERTAVLVLSCCTDSLTSLALGAECQAQVPGLRVVVLAESKRDAIRTQARGTRADAVLHSKADVPAVVGLLARLGPSPIDPAMGVRHLTPREAQIVHYVSSGFRNAQIADTIGIAEKTVKVNLTNIYGKLGIRCRTELAALAPQLLGSASSMQPAMQSAPG